MKIRHLVIKKGAAGDLHYWQPSAELRFYGWLPRRLPDDRAEAVRQAEQLNADVDAWRQGNLAPDAPPAAGVKAKQKAPPRGSVKALIQDYKASRFWQGLAPRTHKDYGWCLDLIDDWAGDMPARAITPPTVQAFYEGLRRRTEGRGRNRRVVETPARAAAAVRVLRLLLQVGVRLGYVTGNAAAQPAISHQRQREPVLWSPAAVRHMAAAADALGWRSIGTAILLNEWFGQRVADVLRLPPLSASGELAVRQGKTGRRVALPVHLVPHLVQRIQAEAQREGAVRSLTHLLLHDNTGQAWNLFTFSHEFSAVRDLATKGSPEHNLPPMPECADLQFRELRHTAVTRLHEAGNDPLGISGITGHTEGSARAILDRHYLVRTTTAAEAAIRRRVAHERGE